MKIIILHILLISILGFSSNPKYMTMETGTTSFTDIQTELTSGEWRLCKVINNRRAINYNICSKLIFNTNNTGLYINPSSNQFTFRWELLNADSLNIMNVEEDKGNKSINEGCYKIIFTNKLKCKEIRLKHLDSDLIYFLWK
jgi:hypothetical protein